MRRSAVHFPSVPVPAQIPCFLFGSACLTIRGVLHGRGRVWHSLCCLVYVARFLSLLVLLGLLAKISSCWGASEHSARAMVKP